MPTIEVNERFTLLLALVYFLYINEYIDDEALWNKHILDLPESRQSKWEDGDPIFHAAMYGVGERHNLPVLQQRAYQCFVLLFATQPKTQTNTFRWRHTNIFSSFKKIRKKSEEETEEETKESDDDSHAAVEESEPGLSDEHLSRVISAVMADSDISSMMPILHLLVHALLARKQWPEDP